MANLWIRLTKQFGARWASQYGDCDDGTWASALRGVDSQTLGQALGRVALSGSEFPPSLPEFLAICGRASGLPDAGTAYANACHNRWSHAVVYEAAKRVGIYELRTRAERDMMPKFREHYGAVCAAAPVLASAVRGTRDSVKTLLGASTRENTMEKAAQALSQKASGLYEQAEAAGVRFKQPAIQRVSADILGSVGRPNAILRPKTTGLMQELEDMQSAGDMSLIQLDEFRQMIGKEMKTAQPSDLRTLQIMKDKLDDFSYNASASDVTGDHANGVRLIKDARRAWSMKAKAQTLDDIYGAAELNASGQTNNQSLGTVINGFKALAKDQKKMRFFTPEEQKQIKLIVSGETGERVLRLIGRFSPTGPVSGGVSGAAIAGLGPAGLAIPVAGIAAKGAATRATQRNINTLEDLLMQGERIPGTRLSSPGRLPASTPYQDALMRVLQGSGIALPNLNQ